MIYMQATYATDDVIATAEAEIENFKQPERMSAVRYLEVLWWKELRCGHICEELLKGMFIEGLHE